MKCNTNIILLFTILFSIFSCTSANRKEIITQQIQTTGFRHVVEIDGNVESVRSTNITCPQVWQVTIKYLIEDGTSVSLGDTICILEKKELENEYVEQVDRLQQEKAEFNKLEANLALQYAMLNAQVKNNEAQALIAQLDSFQLKYSSETNQEITKLELKKTRIIKKMLEGQLDALERINKSELRKLELKIKRRENRLQWVIDEMDKLVLLSGQEGIAICVRQWNGTIYNVGDQVWPGQKIVEIPDFTETKVKFQASETKFKQLSIGDKIEYTFNSMPDNLGYGKIIKLARIGKPIDRKSKIKSFEVEASIDSVLHMPAPGLSVNCTVVIKEVADTIVVPLIAIFEEDSLKYAYVKTPKGFNRTEVLLGEMSNKDAVVISGLNGSAEIALMKPYERMILDTITISEEKKEKFRVPLDSLNKKDDRSKMESGKILLKVKKRTKKNK